MKQTTASGVVRLLPDPSQAKVGCNEWLKDDAEWSQDSNEDLDLGNAFHEAAEGYALGYPWSVDKHKDKPWYDSLWARYCQFTIWFDSLPVTPGIEGHVEVPLAYNIRTGRARTIVGSSGHRDYSSLDPIDEIGGTADLILVGQSVVVYDYKTGREPVPADSPQMKVLGAIAAKAFGADHVILCVVTCHEDGVYERFYTLYDVQNVLDNLAYAMDHAATGPKIGPYCNFCPHRKHCPGVKDALESLSVAVPASQFKLSTHIATASHAAWLAQTLPLAEKFVDECKKALKVYADTNDGVPIGDDSMYEGKPQTKTSPRLGAEAVSYLKKHGLGKAIMAYTNWKVLQEEAKEKGIVDIRDIFMANGWYKESEDRVYRIRKRGKKDE